jgi:DegV family protein with EDD domain
MGDGLISMKTRFRSALAAGNERIVTWADILDRINVFPVPDGDTGRNLVVSLSPFRHAETSLEEIPRELLMSARGNSGNIAARFFSGFLGIEDFESMLPSCRQGRDLAYEAVSEPKPGTMLSLFDALVESLKRHSPDQEGAWVSLVLEDLERAVRATTEQLPELKEAGVVDAGALGMFVFFDSCFNTLVGREAVFSPVAEELKEFFDVADSWEQTPDRGYCLDVVVELRGGARALQENGLFVLDKSIITIPEGDFLKVHLHSLDKEGVRERLEGIGDVVRWAADDLEEQTKRFRRKKGSQALHIITDGAGSITRDDAADLGMTLLASYITVSDTCLPETYVDRDYLYAAMREGVKISTSQASVFERHQCYHKALSLYPRALYMCVGSFYTGNYEVAKEWKMKNDPEDRLSLLDSGSASGRLGLAAIATARFSLSTTDPEAVVAFARKAVEASQELLFLDKLQFLAAGGRMSKTGALFGDVLHVKPVVTPAAEGAKKVAVVRNQKDQLKFALKYLGETLSGDPAVVVMLEYTDNKEWVKDFVQPAIKRILPSAEFILQPVSLTSAAHMGPGTWGVAFLPLGDLDG